jgi:hypothetical protein
MARNFVSMLWLTDLLSLDERVNRVGQVILQATAIAAKNPVKGHPILVTIAMRYLSTRKLGAVGLLAISAFAYANAGSKFITIQTKGLRASFPGVGRHPPQIDHHRIQVRSWATS